MGQVHSGGFLCSEVEHQLEGEGPWGLPDGSEDLEIIFTPGHSEAHCVLFYKAQKVMLRRLHHAKTGWQQHGMTAILTWRYCVMFLLFSKALSSAEANY